MSPITESRKQSMLRYAKTNLKRVPLDLPKDEYERILTHVKEHGYSSLNGWIKSAISAQIERDSSPTMPEISPDEWRTLQMALHIASAHGYAPPTLDSITAKLTEITGEAPAAEPAPADPPKRRRGRPRKNPAAE